jgi:uncharacterized cofD-like protein
VGNLLIVALWELASDDPVQGLDWVGRLLKATGRVLPMSTVPLEIEATVEEPDGSRSTVRGQVAVATTQGRIVEVGLSPAEPPACAEAVAAIEAADWVVLGPGSWFTSVIPHLLVPELADALVRTTARRMVIVNLEPQPGETSGFTPESYLEVLRRHAPQLRLDVVLADPSSVPDLAALQRAAELLGAAVVLADVRSQSGLPRHDPKTLAAALEAVVSAPMPPSGFVG